MVTKRDFLEMEASLWLTRGPKMLLKVDCLPNAIGKQLSIPLINLGSTDDDDDDAAAADDDYDDTIDNGIVNIYWQ